MLIKHKGAEGRPFYREWPSNATVHGCYVALLWKITARTEICDVTKCPIPPPVHISELDVARALKSSPNGRAPGPSYLRANHLKEAVFCPSPIRAEFALKGLVGIVNVLSAGCAPRCIIPFLCGASLIACQKKDGGLRPIAIGEVLRRLTSKCVARAVQSEAVDILSPLQVGVGIPAGCEAIVHSLASLLNNSSILPESRCVLLVDFSNAFNSIDRGHMFEEARSRIPSISSWLECCYSSQPLLFFGEHTILSCCGVQQGDPLGPLGFVLALHPIVERIKREVPGLLLNSWYLDDGTFAVQLATSALLWTSSRRMAPLVVCF